MSIDERDVIAEMERHNAMLHARNARLEKEAKLKEEGRLHDLCPCHDGAEEEDRKPAQAKDYQVGGSHYKDLGVEPWDVMEAWDRDTDFRGFLRYNILKYTGRLYDKDTPLQNARKISHYAQRLVEYFETRGAR